MSPLSGAAQMIMAATTGAALSAISQPGMYGDVSFATQLREAVIASVTVAPGAPTTSKRRVGDENGPTLATAAATLKSKVATEDTPLTQPEQALLQQWLTALADTPALDHPTAGPACTLRSFDLQVRGTRGKGLSSRGGVSAAF